MMTLQVGSRSLHSDEDTSRLQNTPVTIITPFDVGGYLKVTSAVLKHHGQVNFEKEMFLTVYTLQYIIKKKKCHNRN